MNKTRLIVVSALALGSAITMQAQEGAQGRGVKAPSLSGRYVLRGALESRVVTGQPYSAEIVTESIQTLADGNRIVHRSTGRVYRDSQGRVRREDDPPTGSPTISITDPVGNVSITLDGASKTARETPGMQLFRGFVGSALPSGTYTYALNGVNTQTFSLFARRSVAALQGLADAGADGARSEEPLPNRTIEGVMASGVRRTTTIVKGAVGNEQPILIVSEEWTSTDLQVLVLTDFNDPRTGRSTYKLLKITRAEPDASLFKAPAGYTVQRTAGGRGRGR